MHLLDIESYRVGLSLWVIWELMGLFIITMSNFNLE